MIYKLGEKIPKIAKDVFIASNACIIGEVQLSEGVTVWYSATLRGNIGKITVGNKTNIQDGVILHVEEKAEIIIGENVTIGHGCIIHGCRIGDFSLIGMGSIITDDVIIPKNCFVQANSFVTSKIGEIPEGSFIKGNPAKIVGKISEQQRYIIEDTAEHYFKEGIIFNRDLEEV